MAPLRAIFFRSLQFIKDKPLVFGVRKSYPMSPRLLFTVIFLLICPVTVRAEPSDIISLGDLPGGFTTSSAVGVSGDGLVVAGSSNSASGSEAFIWDSGSGMVGLGDLPGGFFSSSALGISKDGTTIVGSSWAASGFISYYWTSGTGLVNLGDLPGGSTFSIARAVSADGSVIIGQGQSASGTEAYRWTSGTGMVGLGDLAGGSQLSSAYGVSGDGTTVVGFSSSVNGTEAFLWTSGSGMVGLGDLAGGAFSSTAVAANVDGTVIVGQGTSASGSEAFLWTAGTGMVGLGDLPGGSFNSTARAVSSDGTRVVGFGTTAAGTSAYIWDQANGMRELATILTGLGVDLTGWTLVQAYGISDNGERVVGEGTYLGNTSAYLAIISDAIGGLTTVDDLTTSLSEAQVAHQQATSQMGIYTSRGLFLARNALSYFPKIVTPRHQIQQLASPAQVEPAAGDETYLAYDNGYFDPGKWAFYTLGSFAMGQDNNPDSHSLDGSAGVLYRADKNWIIGAGALTGQTNIDLGNGGKNTLDLYGGEILSSYQHPSGVQLHLIAFASYLTLDSSRGYLNGGGRSYSYGESEGYGYGASARLGYEMDILPERGFTATPYIETEYSKTKLDGYTEQQGPFPASYSDQSGERVIGRAGLELSHDIGDTVTVRGRAAYAHRLHDAEDTVTASSTGLTMTLSPNKVDNNWVEGGVSLLWQADDNIHLSADLSGRTGRTEDPYARATLGLSMGF